MRIKTFEQLINVSAGRLVYGFKSPPTQSPKPLDEIDRLDSMNSTTIKRLFSLSGNICAYPGCKEMLVTSEGVVIGEICHIKAKNEKGPRYDVNQTVAERESFENLILMCSVHHKIIDTDYESYTVDRLIQIKNNHESGQSQVSESDIDATIINTLIEKLEFNTLLEANTVSIGSITGDTTINQTIVTESHQKRKPGSIKEILTDVSSERIKLSEALIELLPFAKQKGAEDLILFCEFELNGFEDKYRDKVDQLWHRITRVIVSPVKVTNVYSINTDNISFTDFRNELLKRDNFEEVDYLFPDSIIQIESAIERTKDIDSRKAFYTLEKDANEFIPKGTPGNFQFIVYIYLMGDTYIGIYHSIKDQLIRLMIKYLE